MKLVFNPEESVILPIHTCTTCGKKFIGAQTYKVLTEEYGKFLVEARKDVTPDANTFDTFASESKLHNLGYNVRDGERTESERHQLLAYLYDNGYISHFEICKDIEQAIRLFSKRKNFEIPVMKWKNDLEFINNYIKEKIQ